MPTLPGKIAAALNEGEEYNALIEYAGELLMPHTAAAPTGRRFIDHPVKQDNPVITRYAQIIVRAAIESYTESLPENKYEALLMAEEPDSEALYHELRHYVESQVKLHISLRPLSQSSTIAL